MDFCCIRPAFVLTLKLSVVESGSKSSAVASFRTDGRGLVIIPNNSWIKLHRLSQTLASVRDPNTDLPGDPSAVVERKYRDAGRR